MIESFTDRYSQDHMDVVNSPGQCDKMGTGLSYAIRSCCKDIWNASMVEGATFCRHDIPFCPTTADQIPKRQIHLARSESHPQEAYRAQGIEEESIYEQISFFTRHTIVMRGK